MSDFRQLTPTFSASPQIDREDVTEAARLGFTLIVNNRPDGEAPDEPQSEEIAGAAREAGLDYLAIPISHAGFSDAQVTALAEALETAQGPVLAYCRSGTRSTLLWALARARAGEEPARIAILARNAGYDVSPVSNVMDLYANRSGRA